MKNEHTRARHSYPCRRTINNSEEKTITCFDFIFIPGTQPYKDYGLLVIVTIGPPIRAVGREEVPEEFRGEWSVEKLVVLDEHDRPVPWSHWWPHSAAIRKAIAACIRTLP